MSLSSNTGFSTLYAHGKPRLWHLSKGATDRHGGGHGANDRNLHFEIHKDGKRLDPATFLADGNAQKLAPFLVAEGS
jgi:murein DD-endopeptidase MepM/ murein hydrolase activator NlpD